MWNKNGGLNETSKQAYQTRAIKCKNAISVYFSKLELKTQACEGNTV